MRFGVGGRGGRLGVWGFVGGMGNLGYWEGLVCLFRRVSRK